MSTISVRVWTCGSTLHTQISSLSTQRAQCPLKSRGVVERMCGLFFPSGARRRARQSHQVIELALQCLRIDRAFEDVERSRVCAVEHFFADAQARADHEDDLARQALFDEFDATPNRGTVPKAEHLAQDKLASFALREAQIRHAQTNAGQLQHFLRELGAPRVIFGEGVEERLYFIAWGARFRTSRLAQFERELQLIAFFAPAQLGRELSAVAGFQRG